ncbi:MAG: molybdopterin-guanine dinucleotide biosynthesis protein B [Rhodospirillales bacterium CG15_BIG_FIL_POST_REV_8_21_14_020_66_15]|nr:MAG: molybdopterin-guanine dinucleotide biosynthesis protein B [Rhodospirillales bacterium CG15_BIG_FIL_POST_REV_8_21_14_020_66_15]
MKVFGLVGWSGSGKTTLLVRLIPELTSRGLAVSTMKHTHHNFDIDQKGKDSYEHRAAGATEVMLTSGRRWVLQREFRDDMEPDMDDLIARMAPVDLILIEGFKRHLHAKMEVFRAAVGKGLLAAADDTIVAVASVDPVEGVACPVLDLNDVPAVADFIVDYCGLAVPANAEQTGKMSHGAA